MSFRFIPMLFFIAMLWHDTVLGQYAALRPNVILFLVDDYGYGDISFEGNHQIATPNIDRIARHGAHFTRFYQSSAACAPTRASVLTGRYHLETGVWDVHDGRDFLHRDETTIAEVFQNSGYATAAFGKWHSGKTNRYFSWNRGFDLGIHPKLYTYLNTSFIFNNKVVRVEGAAENILGDQVVDFIRQNKDRSFFAYVPIQSIHEPYNCPEELFHKYKNIGYSDHVARLYGMIELLDQNIGKVLNEIEDLNLAENTLVIFLCDDGPSPGKDLSYNGRRMNDAEKTERSRAWSRLLRGGKASIYEGGSITPFYMMWKGHIAEGQELNQLSGIIDIYPTLLEVCKIQLPENNLPLAGKSFWPLIEGKGNPAWDDRFYFDNTNFYLIPRGRIDTKQPRVREISVHHRNFKLIRFDRYHYGQDTVYYELYDLEADPLESYNLVSSRADLVKLLSTKIEDWYHSITAQGRAYQQAVFEIGDWNEQVTPINLDAYEELRLAEIPKQTSFNIPGWTSKGSYIRFKIDIQEKGAYQIELAYDAGENSGARFIGYTESDTAEIIIDQSNSSMSEILHLEKGEQHLTIELIDMGNHGEAIQSLRQLLVHHLPDDESPDVLLNPSFLVQTVDQQFGPFIIRNSAADFMFNASFGNPIIIDKKEGFRILPRVDNPDKLKQVIVYRNFAKIAEIADPRETIELKNPDPGKFTLNVEFISKSGIKNAARAIIEVK